MKYQCLNLGSSPHKFKKQKILVISYSQALPYKNDRIQCFPFSFVHTDTFQHTFEGDLIESNYSMHKVNFENLIFIKGMLINQTTQNFKHGCYHS